jgi:hypothetical protein
MLNYSVIVKGGNQKLGNLGIVGYPSIVDGHLTVPVSQNYVQLLMKSGFWGLTKHKSAP